MGDGDSKEGISPGWEVGEAPGSGGPLSTVGRIQGGRGTVRDWKELEGAGAAVLATPLHTAGGVGAEGLRGRGITRLRGSASEVRGVLGGDSCGRGHSPRGRAGGCTGRRAARGSRGDPGRGAACARGPVRSRLSRVGPGAGRREGRGGGGRDLAPPLPKAGAWPLAPPGGQRQGGFSGWLRAGLRIPGWDPGPLASLSPSLLVAWEC